MLSPLRKRKAIDDFFSPTPKRTTNHDSLGPQLKEARYRTDSASCALELPVPGLTLHASFITSSEEQEILSFLDDPTKCTWRTDLSRRTMHFGGTYCLMPSKSESLKPTKPEILQAPPMPPEFDWLIRRMVEAKVFHHDQIPQYCIVNEYTGNQGISAHTENFQFGEPVVGLSLLSSCPIRFHELTKAFDGSVRSGKAGKAEKTGRKEMCFYLAEACWSCGEKADGDGSMGSCAAPKAEV